MQKYWPEKRCHGKDNIWYAINQVTQEEVILKYFSMSNCDEYKVSREAYTMKYLYNEDPKHFLEMYDYMEDNNEDQYMIAMEKAECSLEDIVNERGHLSEEEAVPVLREILSALKVMHKNNFIHRDLKLSNILIKSRSDLSSIKIIDFGETLDRSDDYHITGMVGTLHYMAPEILKKKKYGKAVDIWAVGVIAYRLLTGYFPYITEGENHSKQLKAILNNSVSYLCADDKRLSIKAIDFINCILDPEPSSRMGIETALEHPFLDPYFEGEFVPYKPIPKFTKKMSKENMKEGKPLDMKGIFRKTIKMTKNHEIIGGSEKIIKNLFNKDEKDQNDNGKTSGITYSKTCVNPNHNNSPLSYSHTTYQSGPYMNGSQTINRNFRNKYNEQNDNNIPEYLNITLGRNSRKPQFEPVQTAGNVDETQPKYSPSNSPSNVNYNNNNNSAGNLNEPQIKINYSPSYSPSNNNPNNNYNNNNGSYESGPIKYSKTYASSNSNANKSNPIKYSKTLAPPKLPKTAGNSIDAYQPAQDYNYTNNNNNNTGNSIDAYQPVENYNSNNLVPTKLPKTAGNTIYTYEEFEEVVNNQNIDKPATRHNRAHSDSTRPIYNANENYQNQPNYGTLPKNGNKNDYNNNNALNQYNNKYSGEIGKSNTYSGDSRARNRNPNLNQVPYQGNSSKPLENIKGKYNHRKNSSTGSNPRYDYDSDSHHRKTPSSGSNPEYIRNGQNSPNMPMPMPVLTMSPLVNSNAVKNSSSPTNDNYNNQYNAKRPSPLATAASIKTSNSVDEKYKQSLKDEATSHPNEKENHEQGNFSNANMVNSSKDEDKNEGKKSKNIIKSLKLKISSKKAPKIVMVETNHPARNSSLFKTKK
ncbi:hypothetical protein H8356DRAFT_933117 [Neocallimastix lanati (nom. inval.)]|nr:hypothetical protein H8356DRAFT_933117 [Neocallimastix sp. JGI-2020a]